MNIKSTYIKLYRFLTTDIWSIRHNEVSPMRFFMYTVLKKLILAVEFTTTKRITSSAAALTYSCYCANTCCGVCHCTRLWLQQVYRSMVSRVVVKSATSSRDNYRLCQLIPCTYQKWPVPWYWSYIYALHSDNACKQHRADFQLYLAGKEASKRLPYHNRLYINVLARSVGHSYNLWYKHLLRHHIPADRRHNAVRSNNAILPATHAICHNVRRVCSIVCVHAKY